MEADDSAEGHDGSEAEARSSPTHLDTPRDGASGVIHLSAGPGTPDDAGSRSADASGTGPGEGTPPEAEDPRPAAAESATSEPEEGGADEDADPDGSDEDAGSEDGDSDDSDREDPDESAPEQVAESETRAAPTPPVIDPAVAERLKRHHVAPALVSLDRVDADDTFRLREDGDLSLLATDVARLGQLFPVDLRLKPPDRFQVICGFRRLAALRFLQRDKVLARLHTDLSDGDALLMALAAGIHGAQVSREQLESVRDRLESEGRLEPAGRDMLEKALAEGDNLAPEGVEEEVDAEELADDVTQRLGEINQDLSLLADAFGALDETRKEELLKQLKYSADLVAFLEGQ